MTTAGNTQAAQVFDEPFTNINWCSYDNSMGGNWPPGPGKQGPQVPGLWMRILPEGWPTHTGSEDPSARNQGNSKDNQCYEEFRSAYAPCGMVMVADNTTPGVEFPQYPAQSGMIYLNPNHAMGYGYYEALIYTPPGPGYNRAFVLYTADTSAGWPWEIDPLQFIGRNSAGQNSDSDVFISLTNNNGTETTDTWLSNRSVTGWHVWGVLVTPTTCIFTLDNEQVFEAPTPPNLVAMDPPLICPYFGMAVGRPDSWQGAPPAGEVGKTMAVRRFRYHPQGSWTGSLLPKMIAVPK